jgi:hypothetical protein
MDRTINEKTDGLVLTLDLAAANKREVLRILRDAMSQLDKNEKTEA